jgi:hypothetical protein
MKFFAFTALCFFAAVASFKLSPRLPKVVTNAIIGASLAVGVANGPVTQFSESQDNFIVHAKETKSVFEGNYNDPNHPGCLVSMIHSRLSSFFDTNFSIF